MYALRLSFNTKAREQLASGGVPLQREKREAGWEKKNQEPNWNNQESESKEPELWKFGSTSVPCSKELKFLGFILVLGLGSSKNQNLAQ